MKIIYTIPVLFSLHLSNVFAQEQIDAVIDWAHRVDLAIPVDGIVKKVSVNTGQKVKKGQVLVELDDRIFRAQLNKARANVNGLKSTYDEINRELSRSQELYDRTVLADHDLQVAKNNVVVAKAHWESAKAEYVKAQIDLELSTLNAPFNSIILKRNVEIGRAIINKLAYDTLITLASSYEYLARAKIMQVQSEAMSLGQSVKVKVKDKTYEAKIIAIEYAFEKTASQHQVTVMFESNDNTLHAGLKAAIIF